MTKLKPRAFARVTVVCVAAALASCGKNPEKSKFGSITDPDWQGHKYYFGWGAASYMDPSNMHNEVKYDVLHTHDLFVKNIGGNYTGTKLIAKEATGTKIKAKWNELREKIKPTDMYFQYSSGHGSTNGLAVGVSYADIRDNTLALNAKETIVFTMACYSGNLVDSFDRVKDRWRDFATQGKTLLVVSSSLSDQTSATGPGTDTEEPSGPNGSAGSAFGHAVWKGIIGYADGAVDGSKDKKVTLDELLLFIKTKTEAVGEHTPKNTGVYDPKLVMTLVPTRAQLESLLGDTAQGRAELESILNDGVL